MRYSVVFVSVSALATIFGQSAALPAADLAPAMVPAGIPGFRSIVAPSETTSGPLKARDDGSESQPTPSSVVRQKKNNNQTNATVLHRDWWVHEPVGDSNGKDLAPALGTTTIPPSIALSGYEAVMVFAQKLSAGWRKGSKDGTWTRNKPLEQGPESLENLRNTLMDQLSNTQRERLTESSEEFYSATPAEPATPVEPAMPEQPATPDEPVILEQPAIPEEQVPSQQTGPHEEPSLDADATEDLLRSDVAFHMQDIYNQIIDMEMLTGFHVSDEEFIRQLMGQAELLSRNGWPSSPPRGPVGPPRPSPGGPPNSEADPPDSWPQPPPLVQPPTPPPMYERPPSYENLPSYDEDPAQGPQSNSPPEGDPAPAPAVALPPPPPPPPPPPAAAPAMAPPAGPEATSGSFSPSDDQPDQPCTTATPEQFSKDDQDKESMTSTSNSTSESTSESSASSPTPTSTSATESTSEPTSATDSTSEPTSTSASSTSKSKMHETKHHTTLETMTKERPSSTTNNHSSKTKKKHSSTSISSSTSSTSSTTSHKKTTHKPTKTSHTTTSHTSTRTTSTSKPTSIATVADAWSSHKNFFIYGKNWHIDDKGGRFYESLKRCGNMKEWHYEDNTKHLQDGKDVPEDGWDFYIHGDFKKWSGQCIKGAVVEAGGPKLDCNVARKEMRCK